MSRKFDRPRPRPICPASHLVKGVCCQRASQRWSKLTQAKSRIGHKCGMRKRLGKAKWLEFVKYAEAKHKEPFLDAFTPSSGILCCHGKLDPCPKELQLDLRSSSSIHCEEELPKLHLDHTYDVARICQVWSDALPAEPNAWDEGICGQLVAHLLFGTEDHALAQCSPIWRQQLVFRCGDTRGVEGQRASDFCHDLLTPHSNHRLEGRDIRWPA